MVYGSRISISKDDIEYLNVDFKKYTKNQLVNNLGREIGKKVINEIIESSNSMTGGMDYELRVVAYSMQEFSERIKLLRSRISHLSKADQTNILNVFIGEDDNRYNRYNKNEKIYI